LSQRVLVVDDDPVMLSTARRVLERAGLSVETYDVPSAFLRTARLDPPCCVLLDLQMPGLSGLEVQDALARAATPPAVVFMSARADVPSSVRAMKGGAVDFLTKPFGAEDLVAAVRAALDRAEARLATAAKVDAARGRFSRLSPRERQVADLLVSGLKNREIASRLGTVEKTIKVHRGRIMKKVGAASFAELVKISALAGAGGEGAA
jgi:FixJ family two-component response regulator